MRILRRLLWPAIGIAMFAVAVGLVEARHVFAPLLGLAIWRVGTASFASLHAGAAHVPDGPPQVVDTRTQRILYWCSGCGAELLLLVRGTDTAPRHCGERMTERREVPGTALN